MHLDEIRLWEYCNAFVEGCTPQIWSIILCKKWLCVCVCAHGGCITYEREGVAYYHKNIYWHQNLLGQKNEKWHRQKQNPKIFQKSKFKTFQNETEKHREQTRSVHTVITILICPWQTNICWAEHNTDAFFFFLMFLEMNLLSYTDE